MKIHIYAWPLGRVILLEILGVAVWGLLGRFCEKKGKTHGAWCWLNRGLLLAALYGILRYTVLRKPGGNEAEFKFLRSWAEFVAQPELFREMVMNAFLYYPLGLTMPFIFQKERKRNALITVAFAFLLSSAIEFCQYHYAMGNGEITDILMNTLGAAVGATAYGIARKELHHT